MKHPSKFTPQETKNLELDWYEYLLRDNQRKYYPPAKRLTSTSNNNYGYVLLFGVIFMLLCYIASFFI